MKQECPTYLKTIGKSKTLVVTLSDTEPEDDFDNEDDGIHVAYAKLYKSQKSMKSCIGWPPRSLVK